jgi:hypothetical protein
MTTPQDTLDRIDAAIACFEQALEAIRQVPKAGEHAITVDGIEHELESLAPRLRALRDAVAARDDPGA